MYLLHVRVIELLKQVIFQIKDFKFNSNETHISIEFINLS